MYVCHSITAGRILMKFGTNIDKSSIITQATFYPGLRSYDIISDCHADETAILFFLSYYLEKKRAALRENHMH